MPPLPVASNPPPPPPDTPAASGGSSLPGGREFLNRLPDWIVPDARARGLHRTYLDTLRACANTADPDPRPPRGRPGAVDLINIRGGGRLAERCGVSYRTLQRHLPKLIANGYLVITRLGDPASHRDADRRHVYAIPRRRGALDHAAHRPPMVVHALDPDRPDARGRPARRPHRVRPGGQSSFLPGDVYDTQVSTPGAYDKVSCTPRQGDVAPTSACRTSPSPSPSPGPSVTNTMRGEGGGGGGVSRRGGDDGGTRSARAKASGASGGGGTSGGGWLKGVTEGDLRDTGRLLALLKRAASSGLGGLVSAGNESDRLRFVSMAEHALRVGDKPAALFARNVSLAGRRPMVWAYITQDDEAAARRRLAAWADEGGEQDEPDEPGERAEEGGEAGSEGGEAFAALAAELRQLPGEAFAAERAAALAASGWPARMTAPMREAGPDHRGLLAIIARYRAGRGTP